jgi:hypothetical protein
VVAEKHEHFIHSLSEADENGARDNGVADVEGVEMGDVLKIFANVGVVKTVAGVDLKAALVGVGGGAGVTREFLATRERAGGVGVVAGMKLDAVSAEMMRAIDLRGIGVDERADADLRGLELADDDFKRSGISPEIEAALGGDLLAILGDEADFFGLEAESLLDHRRCGGHFEIEWDANFAGDITDVGFLDMAAILAQVHRDGIGAGLFADLRRLDHGGLWGEALTPVAIARFAERGHVIDVEAEVKHQVLRCRKKGRGSRRKPLWRADAGDRSLRSYPLN